MRRRDFLIWAAATCIGGCTARRDRREATTRRAQERGAGRVRPNVIVIVADDLGYADLGCYGGTDVPTPNIDSLASSGARFTNGYVTAPVCSPTRAGLLTGRYQQRFGHEFNPGGTPEDNFGLPLDQLTLPQILSNHGYATGMVGKWHLGLRPDYHPMRRGFDEYFGFLAGAHPYVNLKRNDRNPILRGTTPVDEDEYLTDAFGREAAAFVDRHHARPFFLYLTFNAIHTPMQATSKYLDRFKHIADERRRTMAAMLSAMDDAVGRVLGALRARDVERNTLIFFISDNGGPTQGNASRNDPLSGVKGQLWEGGIRVPFIMQWKQRLGVPMVVDWPVNSLDVFATSIAGPDILPPRAIDGVDLIPYLQHRSPPDRDALFWRFGESWAVRRKNHKLLKLPDRRAFLFDLAEDPGEKHDLAAQQPDVANDLRRHYDAWDSQLADPLWGQAPRRRRRRQRMQPTTGER